MRKVIDYELVLMNPASDNRLRIKEFLAKGWTLHGSPCACISREWNGQGQLIERHHVAQAVVLYEEEPTDRTLAIAGAAALIKKSDEQDPALFWEEAQHVHRRLLESLPETDPYLFRWRYIAEKKGWLEPAGGRDEAS